MYSERGVKENGKKWCAQRGEKKTRIHFVSRGGGCEKASETRGGRKNRVNTESSDPIPRGWRVGGIGKEACSVVKAVAWNRNIS